MSPGVTKFNQSVYRPCGVTVDDLPYALPSQPQSTTHTILVHMMVSLITLKREPYMCYILYLHICSDGAYRADHELWVAYLN